MPGRKRNGSVAVGNSVIYYVSFGHGKKNLLVLPGLSDGLATVKGKAALLAPPYRPISKEYTVYMFSRKNDMPQGYSIRDMAADQAAALRALGIEKTDVLGVSQGGMIAQYLAADYPELVGKLVLAVTAPYANDTVKEAVSGWMDTARRGDHKSLMIDTAEKSYSPEYLKKYRKCYPLLGMVGKPKSYDRFMTNAQAILGFDARDILGKIMCPTLIIGGSIDKSVGKDAAGELHGSIGGSEMYIYEGLGHAAYEEAKDFYKRVFDFLKKE